MLDVDQYENKKIEDMEAEYPDLKSKHGRIIAHDAVVVQDACNLTGVVHAMAAAATYVSMQADMLGKSTEWKNHHPVMLLFVDKLADLVSRAQLRRYETCLRVCQRAAEKK